MKIKTRFYYNNRLYLKTSEGWIKGETLEQVDKVLSEEIEDALNSLIYT